MIRFAGKGILLDIEGTACSVSYVYDVLFPYARRELPGFLRRHWRESALMHACELLAHDVGVPDASAWLGSKAATQEAIGSIVEEVERLMDADVKATGLKELQGLIWKEGYARGDLRSQVFPDVPRCLAAWQSASMDVRIFSSGSAEAQVSFFSHTEYGDLETFLNGHYDTTTGSKKEAASYLAIAADMCLEPRLILFISDVTAELDAARAAGMHTGLTDRPGNAPVAAGHGHPVIASFSEIELV
jgi:enolase-phosphatase E1